MRLLWHAVRAQSTAFSGTAKVKNNCFIITYSQCDISHLSRAEFADIIVGAWVGISEAHEKGRSHFHVAKNRGGELSESSRRVNAAFN